MLVVEALTQIALLLLIPTIAPSPMTRSHSLDEAQFTAAGLKALGFDSVLGAAGADLNYPETVVYAEEAVLRPAARANIVYTLPAHDDHNMRKAFASSLTINKFG
jgi:hypothetical protein